ncbi:HAAS signaling domain-containing protein [Peterkaempfera bronchialis]|uniref:HAAS signaling domain-containing protein n=1 Tax=Peterkaempfera bronchialis TaxID=2126346 RepID=UPI003C2EEFA7
MGIESDKLVYDYLGRVADLAQTSLPAAERARLIAGLRADIDGRRSAASRDTPAAVRRVLERLGSPDEVVERAARGGVTGPPPQAAAPAASAASAAPMVPAAAAAPVAPAAPVVPTARDAEWWRVPGAPAAAVPEAGSDPMLPVHLPSAGDFPGWDGVEIHFEVERQPEADPAAEAAPDEPDEAEAVAEPPVQPAERKRRRFGAGGRRTGLPLLLESLAALLLAAGALAGMVVPMLLGWLAAYASRRLSLMARRFAVFGIPALAVLGGGVWLWGRASGRWGGPPPTDAQFQESVKALLPLVLRTAAGGSAAFMAWCALRGRPAPPA